MEYRRLGKTGLNVSVLGLGGVFISSLGAERGEGVRAVRRALELGINYIDTARSYGDSESVIGEALRGMKSRPIVSTKIGGWPMPFNPKDLSALRRSVEESMKQLGVERLDMLMVHEPDRPGLFDWWEGDLGSRGPVWEVLADLRERGTVNWIGAAGTTAYELARVLGAGRFDVVLTAFNYSLLWREAAISLLPEAYRRDMGVIVGTPLQQGALAERFDELLESSAWLSPPRREQYRRLYALLDEVGMPIHEAALRWVLSDARVGTVIVGARSVREVEANVAAVEAGPLEEEVLTRLDEIAELVPFRPFEEPGGAFGLPFGRQYRGPGALFGTGAAGGITGQEA